MLLCTLALPVLLAAAALAQENSHLGGQTTTSLVLPAEALSTTLQLALPSPTSIDVGALTPTASTPSVEASVGSAAVTASIDAPALASPSLSLGLLSSVNASSSPSPTSAIGSSSSSGLLLLSSTGPLVSTSYLPMATIAVSPASRAATVPSLPSLSTAEPLQAIPSSLLRMASSLAPIVIPTSTRPARSANDPGSTVLAPARISSARRRAEGAETGRGGTALLVGALLGGVGAWTLLL